MQTGSYPRPVRLQSETLVGGESSCGRGCPYLISSHALSIKEAEQKSDGPCSLCNPNYLTGEYRASTNSSAKVSNQSVSSSEKPNVSITRDTPSEKAEPSSLNTVATKNSGLFKNGVSWEIALPITFIAVAYLLPLLSGILERKHGKLAEEKAKLQLALDALQKVEHLREILAKGYCQDPYTKENMLDIDDFIAYVERFSEEAENILKHKE